MDQTAADAVERAIEVLASLRRLGEEVTDEWQYVADLELVWGNRLRELATARGAAVLSPTAAEALERLGAEAGAIADPHRAIDWLSTYPQAALVALGDAS